jgi:PAS domain S-box-containing protein
MFSFQALLLAASLAALFTGGIILSIRRFNHRRVSESPPSPLESVQRELSLRSLALESALDGIAILDTSGCFTYVNASFAALYHATPPEIRGLNWQTLYSLEERVRLEAAVRPLLRRGKRCAIEAEGQRHDGSVFPQQVTLLPTPHDQIVCVVRDISARREGALEADRLAAFARYSPAPVLRFDATGMIIFANPAAGDILGLSREEATPLAAVIEGASRIDLPRCIHAGEIHTCSAKIHDRFYHFVIRGLPNHGFGHAYGSDVTELKRAHQKLIDSRKFLRKVVDANPNFIFVKDARGRFTLANQAVADAYGTTVGALVGHTESHFDVPAEEIERARTDDRRVMEQHEHLFIAEERMTDVHGKVRWLQTVKKPIVMNRTGEVRVLGVSTDITERKILQDQLLQSQKMEAIGQLAGGISHDFNNLLTGILGYTTLLKMTNERLPEVIRTAELIEGTAHRAAALTQKLLGFARKGKHHNIPVNLHSTIDETLAILQRTIERNISIRLNCSATNSFVMGDPVQLQQVILNLAINARDSMSREAGGTEGGILSITTTVLELATEDLLPEPGLKPGTYLEVAVRDTGCGIPAPIRQKIFEPFFTTKEPDRGTGMGLAMVYGIVRNHGGVVSVYSVEGQGSTFRILLPTTEPIPALLPTPLPTRPPSGNGNVLVVDDHPVVRQVTAKMLAALGYKVTTAHDGVEALEYYTAHADDIDLVILDMVMPRMGARECFRQLKTINSNVRAILSTGYVKNNAVHEIMVDGMAAFIQKPYELSQIGTLVEKVLRGEYPAPSEGCTRPLTLGER